jgi:asparagine synthase (glutamine-hydrolysing)
MSGIGGVYNRNGEPIDINLLTALGNDLGLRAPDGGREILLTSIGMTYRALHTNHESRRESQPLVTTAKHILSWDGRLDNRKDLIHQLGSQMTNDVTDVEIVMAAYLKWGVNFLRRVVGDYALALWDSTQQTLMLARDPFGIRPLFYALSSNSVIWASYLGPILDAGRLDPQIDDEYIAGFLTTFPEPWQTPYKGIDAVPPGQVIKITKTECYKHRFWSLSPDREICYASDAEYEEHFRELFREAISCRLRADAPVWLELSGGFDSTSIIALADQLLKENSVGVPVETVSYVYGEARTADESKFIRCVEESRGKPGHHLREEDGPCLSKIANSFFVGAPSYHHAFVERQWRLRELLNANGGRVLLTGVGGDELLVSNENPDILLADDISQFRLHNLHRNLASWSNAVKTPYVKLFGSAAALLLPRRMQKAVRHRARVPYWFDQEFTNHFHLRDRMLGATDPFGFKLPSKRDTSAGIQSVVRGLAAAHLREWQDLDIAHPYLHLPLVEFLQAVPIEQKLRPGESRSLMRRALGDLLPEAVRRRRGKQGPDEAFSRALRREWNALSGIFCDPEVCARGYIDRKNFQTALTRARHGIEKHTATLFMVVCLEFWFRSLKSRESVSRSTASSPVKSTSWKPAVSVRQTQLAS